MIICGRLLSPPAGSYRAGTGGGSALTLLREMQGGAARLRGIVPKGGLQARGRLPLSSFRTRYSKRHHHDLTVVGRFGVLTLYPKENRRSYPSPQHRPLFHALFTNRLEGVFSRKPVLIGAPRSRFRSTTRGFMRGCVQVPQRRKGGSEVVGAGITTIGILLLVLGLVGASIEVYVQVLSGEVEKTEYF